MLTYKELLLQSIGHFTWMYDDRFFIETPHGNFVWSNPEYGGDNTMTPYKGGYQEYASDFEIGKNKGQHNIEKYCGDRFIVVQRKNEEV